MLFTERELYQREGKQSIVGIDEAGRGCLAGPLSVAAVVFPKLFFTQAVPEELKVVRDSKLLSPQEREKSYQIVKKQALFAENVYISNRIIDEINVNRATERAVLYLVRRLQKRGFECLSLLIDGNLKFPLIEQSFPALDYRSIVKGDSRVLSIAAASIIAKVKRDHRMQIASKHFPAYHLEQNKGYPTKAHRSQIKKLGLSAIHRHSYSSFASSSNSITASYSQKKPDLFMRSLDYG